MLWYYCETASRNLERDGVDVVIVAPLFKKRQAGNIAIYFKCSVHGVILSV